MSAEAKTVLLVDPDLHGRALTKRFLVEHGFTVIEAQDGETGLALALSEHPALVLTEILLAQLDGLNLCRQIKQRAQSIGVAVLSFLIAEDRAKDAGADLFIPKPIQQESLLAAVAQMQLWQAQSGREAP